MRAKFCLMPAVATHAQSAFALGMSMTRNELLRVAIARGCRHYASLLPADTSPKDLLDLPHEVLGVALLRGEPDAETFQAIRVGAMVLSDLDNDPQRIREAAAHFGVTGRVIHLARLGLAADHHTEFWSAILKALPSGAEEASFLPGVSRLASASPLTGLGRPPSCVWLRTHYAR